MEDKAQMDVPAKLSLLQLPHVIWAWQKPKRVLWQAACPWLSLPLLDMAGPCSIPPQQIDGEMGHLLPAASCTGWGCRHHGRKIKHTRPTCSVALVQVLARSHGAETSARAARAPGLWLQEPQQIRPTDRPPRRQAEPEPTHTPMPLARAPELGASCSSRRDGWDRLTDISCASPPTHRVRGGSPSDRPSPGAEARHRDSGYSPLHPRCSELGS